VQEFDKRGDVATAVDSHSTTFRWLIRMNRMRAILLITLATVFGSEAITAPLMTSLSAPRHWFVVGIFISILVPLVEAPLVAAFFLRMVHRLDRAHEIIAELAMTDILTGAYNRRYFMQEAQKEFGKAQRYNLPLSIIMFDADHFKSLNDTYGHSAGDDVLRELSAACKRCIRAPDVFVRYGGEEFVILLPMADGSRARMLAERIRREVEQMSTYCGDVRLPVTISLGVAERLASTASIDEMLREADLRLYVAKKNGRNRVEGAGASDGSPVRMDRLLKAESSLPRGSPINEI
jgi:diguanylate cyclase (GGDEF)-like protein